MSRALKEPELRYLKPGEMILSEEPRVVVTVLGSCLSVTMFHPRSRIGGICHGLLPKCGSKKTCGVDCLEGFKFVDCSIRRMVAIFDSYTIKRSEIEVKCFGGADMFTRELNRPGIVSVGRQNIVTADRILRSEGLNVKVQDVGGMQGRKIFFYTHTGEVLLKRLNSQNAGSGT